VYSDTVVAFVALALLVGFAALVAMHQRKKQEERQWVEQWVQSRPETEAHTGTGEQQLEPASAEIRTARDLPARPTVVDDAPLTRENLRLKRGKTALMHWAAVGHENRVRALLDQGADVRAVDDDGDGVLRYAIGNKNSSLLELLLGRGADARARSTSLGGLPGFTILHAIAEMGWCDGIFAAVRYGADVDARGTGGITAMMLAAGAGQDAAVAALHDLRASANALDDDHDSVLYYAASRGNGVTTALLLSLGADPNPPRGVSGHTPLTIAAQLAGPASGRPPNRSATDFTTVVVELLRAGSDPSALYSSGYALQRTVEGGIEIPPVDRLSRLVAANDDWSVIHLSPAGRARLSNDASTAAPQLSSKDAALANPSRRQARPAAGGSVPTRDFAAGAASGLDGVKTDERGSTPAVATPGTSTFDVGNSATQVEDVAGVVGRRSENLIEDDVDFSEEVFPDHPSRWRSPADLADAFVLAWALEERERRRLDPISPYGNYATRSLPAHFRWDTLGLLLRPGLGGAYDALSTSRGRLTSLCVAWRLFDQLNLQWRLSPGDFGKYSSALAFVTAASYESRGLFQGLNGNVARCLLSDRITRAFAGTPILTESEEWFINGRPGFLEAGPYGVRSIPFGVGGQYVTAPLTSTEFTESVWSMVRVLVRLGTPDHYIAELADRSEMLLQILRTGASAVEQSPGRQAWVLQNWPGWPADF